MIKRIKYKNLLFLIVASLALIMNVGTAQGTRMTSPSYIIKNDVLSGGGARMNSTSYVLESTLGQSTPIGFSESSGSYENWAGFWSPGTYGPTAVFLISFRAYPDGGQVVVEWETSSEIGTVGFYLLRLDEETGKYHKLNKKLLPGLLHSPQGGVYRYVDQRAESDGTYTYKLLEVEVRGRKRSYGPFTVTVGDEGIFGSSSTFARSDMEAPIFGFSRKAHKMSSAKKARIAKKLQTASRELIMASAMEPVVSDKVKIAVKQSGLYYVDASEIANVMGETTGTIKNWIKRKRLILKNLGKNVAWLAAQGNLGIYFYGQAIDSIYTNKNIYCLTKGRRGQGLTMDVVEGQGPSPAVGNETFTETIHIEEDHYALIVLFDDPQADYWLWDYISAGYVDRKSFTLAAARVAETGTASLTVYLQGATDTESNQDHHAVVTLNGIPIGEGYWDGASAHELVCEFDQDLLNEGNNLEVVGLLDTGAPYSTFYVDSFDLTYQRYYHVVDDRLLARGDGNDVITIDGFTSDNIFVFMMNNNLRKPKLVQATTVDEMDGNYRVSFTPANPNKLYLTLTLDTANTPVSVIPDIPSNLKRKRNKADYLVITPSELKEAAGRLADYRQGQGLETMVVNLEDIYDEFNYGLSNPEAIQDFLTYAYQRWRKPPGYVVLAGEGTYDYKNNRGYADNLLPPLMVATPDGLFASDNRFSDVEGDDGVPEMAIGRLPVVTSDELDVFIDKIVAYENAGGGDWTNRVLMLADNPDNGGDFPSDSDAIAALLTTEYTTEKIYLSEYSIADARTLILDSINNGALLVNYIGHAGLERLSQEGMLLSTDVDFLINEDRLPVVTAMTCLAGRFAFPGYDSVSERLVLHQSGGAIAVWAPTGFSLNELAVVLDKGFFCSAFEDQEKILGDIVLRALEDYAWAGKPRFMLDIYNLLGDPALQMW